MASVNSNARRCSMCNTNWPNTPSYSRCPRPSCDSFTFPFKVAEDKVLTEAEASKLRKTYEFEKWLDREGPAKKAIREAEVNAKVDARVSRSEVIREQFNEVIENGGFTDDDRRNYAQYEEKLPHAHINKFIDPKD